MRKEDFTFPSSDGQTKIHCRRWVPDGEPKAVLQILHGMVEFIGRYGDFAAFLADHGYLVVGNDHLGHGESVVKEEDHGYFGNPGNQLVIRDIDKLRRMTQAEHPDIPYFMMGHSMGSFLVRQYITETAGVNPPEGSYDPETQTGTNADGLAGVIIMGTGWQPAAVLKLGKAMSKTFGAIRGQRHRSKFIDAMAFGSNNSKIKNARTRMDWLTKDDSIVDWYLNEDWCTFRFTVNAYYNMFKGIELSQDAERMGRLPEGLPLLLVSGADDPVGNYGEGVRKAFMAYKENTKCNVDIKLYLGDRHEILNETDKDVVYNDLLDWLEEVMGARPGSKLIRPEK